MCALTKTRDSKKYTEHNTHKAIFKVINENLPLQREKGFAFFLGQIIT